MEISSPMTRTAAVVDVGSNTVRLVVARCGVGAVETMHTERVRLRLAREIQHDGRLAEETVAATAAAVRAMCARARRLQADSLDVLVTAPGRQAGNGHALAEAIERAARHPVRILSPDDEARLAFAGAVALAAPGAGAAPVAVVDLGGASTEIAIGRPAVGPAWLQSVDLGAARLAEAMPATRPGQAELDAARAAVADAFAHVTPPRAGAALVVGGSARALGRVLGPTLGAGELAAAASLLPACRRRELARRFGVGGRRARLLVAAALILAEVQRKLAVPLEVADGGVREGALLAAAGAAAG